MWDGKQNQFAFPTKTILSRKRSRPLIYHKITVVSLGKSRGGNALSLLEVKEPRGSLCVFGNFLHIRKLPRCGARSSTKERFAESSVRSKVPNLSFLPRNKAASRFPFCGLMPPTLALTFLLREKSAKAYPRGSVLLDISSGTIKFAKNLSLFPQIWF